MVVKLCGIKHQENYNRLCDSDIDWIGFNFYSKSKRFLDPDSNIISTNIKHKRVGVFVNEKKETILDLLEKHSLDMVQLHGNESPEMCYSLQTQVPVIKVFQLDSDFDYKICDVYKDCSCFLFDTKSKNWGGSGKKFDWSILSQYHGTTPFLLSGGIGPADVNSIKDIKHPALFGVDINSGFETEPGIKDAALVKTFVNKLRR